MPCISMPATVPCVKMSCESRLCGAFFLFARRLHIMVHLLVGALFVRYSRDFSLSLSLFLWLWQLLN